jgi:Fic family protein
MDIESFVDTYGHTRQVSGAAYAAYYPKLLPFNVPYDDELVKALAKAHDALAALRTAGDDVENPDLLITPYLKREAYASTRIEGTQTNLDRVYAADDPGDDPDLEEVTNYVKTLKQGLRDDESFTVDELQSLHRQLLSGGRGQNKNPGEYRGVPARIGSPNDDITQARFVPPPADEIPRLMDNLVDYMNSGAHANLLTAAITHYQFETIHPFSDGNGRLGRLIIPLFLVRHNDLHQPLLYLSDYFNKNRGEYMERLYKVSQAGELHAWITFFLDAVRRQSNRSRSIIQRLNDLKQEYIDMLRDDYRSANLFDVTKALFAAPYITTKKAAELTETKYQTAHTNLKKLRRAGILRESHKQGRQTVYVAPEILRILKS